jgi:phage host-nuclease inhibitor protein Gam
MSTFVDHVLHPVDFRESTRAERIEKARRSLERAKTARKIDRASVTRYRRELTRQTFYLRVAQGDALAASRWRWIQQVQDFRRNIGSLSDRVSYRVTQLEADRERLAHGRSTKGPTKGQVYSTATLQNLTRNVAQLERELAEAEP